MTTLLEVLHKKAEPYKVTLTRGQKGTYGWEITVNADTPVKAIEMLQTVDMNMRVHFGGGDVHE